MYNVLFTLLVSCQAPECYTVTPTTAGDISQPLIEAMALCRDNPPVSDTNTASRGGCRFELPAGDLLMTQTVKLCRQHDIVGKGGRFRGARTRVEVPGCTTPFVLADFEECTMYGEGGGAGGALLSDFALVKTHNTCTTQPDFGVVIEAPNTRLERLYVSGFVQNVRVSAGKNRSPSTNANLTKLVDSTLTSAKHTGLLIEGEDANAGYFADSDIQSNCNNWRFWEPVLGRCANVHENSFLGNTFNAIHTARCVDLATGQMCESFYSEGDSQRATFVGPYTERDQLPGVLSRNTVSIGGLSEWSGKGGWLQGRRMNALILVNELDPSNPVQLELGEAANLGGVALQLRAPSISNWPLSVNATKTGFWSFRLANSEAWSFLRVAGNKDIPGFSLADIELAPVHDGFWMGGMWFTQ